MAGPVAVIAYSTCIAHGIDMATSMTHQKDAVRSGYWPLYRYHPGRDEHDAPVPARQRRRRRSRSRTSPRQEARFAMLARTNPEHARRAPAAWPRRDVDERWRLYEQLAGVERTVPTCRTRRGAHETDATEEVGP